MHGASNKTKVVSFRLSIDDYNKIEKFLQSPNNPNTSVPDYCKTVIERWINRKH